MEKIFDIRFLVPPILTGVFIFLFYPQHFLCWISKYDLVQVLSYSTLFILALGVIISSLVDRYISFNNLRSSKYSKTEKAILKSTFLGAEDINMTENEKKDSDALELGCWLVLNSLDDEKKHLQDQIHKRWSWAISNFNFLASLVLAVFTILLGSIFKIIPPVNSYWALLWTVGTVFMGSIFYFNGEYARKSVLKMDRILVRNFSNILDNNKTNLKN